EASIHDVHVHEVRPARLRHRERVGQARESRGQQRRRDPYGHRGVTTRAASDAREPVTETTSRDDSGEPAGGNCFRIVFGGTPSYDSYRALPTRKPYASRRPRMCSASFPTRSGMT